MNFIYKNYQQRLDDLTRFISCIVERNETKLVHNYFGTLQVFSLHEELSKIMKEIYPETLWVEKQYNNKNDEVLFLHKTMIDHKPFTIRISILDKIRIERYSDLTTEYKLNMAVCLIEEIKKLPEYRLNVITGVFK
jgi:hypothetical protein